MRRRALRKRYGRMTQLELPFHNSVKDVIGRSRQIQQQWPDGYTCPFCGSAAGIESRPWCSNPGCSAGKDHLGRWYQTPESVRKNIDQAEARKKEEEWRVERDKFSRNYAEERRVEESRRLHEVLAEAGRRGACPKCATEPLPYRPPKYVKHRGKCPKEHR